jgi:hypothetical protein
MPNMPTSLRRPTAAHNPKLLDRSRCIPLSFCESCEPRWNPLRAYTDALGCAMNQGFFEFELRSGDRTFITTVELLPPGLEASEARAKVPEVWELYFAAPEVIAPGSTKCVDSRPILTKPEYALKVPKGIAPVLIWKSEEK